MQTVPYRINPKEKHTKTHTNQTNKDETQRKNIKSSRGKAKSNIQGKPHRLNSLPFSRKIFQEIPSGLPFPSPGDLPNPGIEPGSPALQTGALPSEPLGKPIFKVLKGKILQPRLLYPTRISFKIDGKIKKLYRQEKLREFSTTKPALQQMLKGFR